MPDYDFYRRQRGYRARTPPTPPYEPRYYDFYYNDRNYLLDEYYNYRDRYHRERRRHRRRLANRRRYPDYPTYYHDLPVQQATVHYHHHDKDHNQPFIHYLSPRVILPHEHVYASPHESPHKDVVILKPKYLSASDPGVARAVMHSGKEDFAWDSHCYYCRSHPQIFSKNIPSMYYDQLRCPHCAAHAQPSQQQVLAYPWTVQSNHQAKSEGTGLDKLSVNTRKIDVVDMSVASQGDVKSIPGAAVQTSLSDPVLRSKPKSLRPLKTRRKTLQTVQPEQKPVGEKNAKALSVIQEDDVSPKDSISNVGTVLGIRSQGNEPILKRVKPRVETEVDLYYPREKYFSSYQNSLPHMALSTPRPLEIPSTTSRTFHGQYFDRQQGRTYTYNVKYAHRKLRGNRDLEN